MGHVKLEEDDQLINPYQNQINLVSLKYHTKLETKIKKLLFKILNDIDRNPNKYHKKLYRRGKRGYGYMKIWRKDNKGMFRKIKGDQETVLITFSNYVHQYEAEKKIQEILQIPNIHFTYRFHLTKLAIKRVFSLYLRIGEKNTF